VWHLKEDQAGTGSSRLYKDSTANTGPGKGGAWYYGGGGGYGGIGGDGYYLPAEAGGGTLAYYCGTGGEGGGLVCLEVGGRIAVRYSHGLNLISATATNGIQWPAPTAVGQPGTIVWLNVSLRGTLIVVQ